MNFHKGDIVRYTTDIHLASEFLERWGRGPFQVSYCHLASINCVSMDGEPVINKFGANWNFGTTNLILDPFLDSARKAVASES